jgi:beta-glucosidase-like glycosyl hydrolase
MGEGMSDYEGYLMSDDETWKALVSCVSRDDRKGAFGIINAYCDQIIMARELCKSDVATFLRAKGLTTQKNERMFDDSLWGESNEQEE